MFESNKFKMLKNMDEVENTNANFPQNPTMSASNNPPALKRKRNLPGNPDPEAEVIALSPKTLMATNRFLCETCGKGFQRDQNLQLHRRGHNLPWKLKQRTNKEIKKRVYVCPEKTCVHHDPSRALGDLTGIKKHFCRKHGEKKWKCEKCSKRYAVQSDWKAHSKTCGTREYKCDCGTIFSRRDSFITHRAFCDALAEETARVSAASEMNNSSLLRGNIGNYTNIMGTTSLVPNNNMPNHFPSIFKPISTPDHHHHHLESTNQTRGLSLWMNQTSHSQPHETMITTTNGNSSLHEIHQQIDSSSREIMYGGNENPPPYSNNYQLNWVFGTKLSNNCSQELITSTTTSLPLGNINVNVKDVSHDATSQQISSLYSSQHQISHQTSSANMSATALLQKAAQIGSTSTDTSFLGSLGLKCSNNNSTNDVNKFGGTGMYGTSSSLLISLGNEEDHNNACDFSQMHPSKRRHVQGEENGGGGQTRDFLGVGVQTICHPSSINGWI